MAFHRPGRQKRSTRTPAIPLAYVVPPFHLTTLFLRQTILDWANCGILFERVACRVFIHVVHPCARARPRTINDQKMAGRTDRGDEPQPSRPRMDIASTAPDDMPTPRIRSRRRPPARPRRTARTGLGDAPEVVRQDGSAVHTIRNAAKAGPDTVRRGFF